MDSPGSRSVVGACLPSGLISPCPGKKNIIGSSRTFAIAEPRARQLLEAVAAESPGSRSVACVLEAAAADSPGSRSVVMLSLQSAYMMRRGLGHHIRFGPDFPEVVFLRLSPAGARSKCHSPAN